MRLLARSFHLPPSQRRSLRSQLLRSQLATSLIVLGLCSSAYIWNDLNSFKNNLCKQITGTSLVLSRNLVSSLEFLDEKNANETLDSLSSNPDIVSALVMTEGKLFAHYGDTQKLEPLVIAANSDENLNYFSSSLFIYSSPIVHHGNRLGTLYIASKLNSLQNEYSHYFYIVFFVSIAGILLAFFISDLFQKGISKPINILLSVIKNIALSDSNSLRISHEKFESKTEEIDLLAKEFDQMLLQIEIRDQAISKAKNNLEIKVEERTQELIKAHQELVHTGRLSALGEMAAGIAHEINNPLAVISGKCSVIQKKLATQPLANEEIKTDLERIQYMSERISKIIRGLKAFSRDGNQDPFEKSSLSKIIEDTLELCGSRFKNHQIELKILPFPEIEFECRSTQIGQVILNLLNNAFDAIQAYPEKWVQVEVTLPAHEQLQIKVTDSGPGIPKEVREKIMQPFFTTKEVGKGTGLGLSISRGIIHAHQGKMEIDSDHPHTCFKITLPLKQKKPLSPSSQAA